MDVHLDSALTILSAVFIILLVMAAWTWIKFAKQPEDQRENVAYATAAVLGFTALIVAYVVLIYI